MMCKKQFYFDVIAKFTSYLIFLFYNTPFFTLYSYMKEQLKEALTVFFFSKYKRIACIINTQYIYSRYLNRILKIY